MVRKYIITLALVSLLTVPFITKIEAESMVNQIDTIARACMDNDKMHGALLVAKQGEIIYQNSCGFADYSWGIKNTLDTKFRVYSLSKQFTAMVIMKLVQEGRINLDYPITTYIPWYREDTGSRITVHHLLTHTHGIPDPPSAEMEYIIKTSPKETVLKYFSGDLKFEPGTKFRYSGVGGYTILGAIAEEVTGKTLKTLMKEQIFEPLEMDDTYYLDMVEIIPKKATDYTRGKNNFLHRLQPYILKGYGASSVVTTVADLLKWDKALRDGKLLHSEYMELYEKPHIDAGNGNYYAYGQYVSVIKNGEEKHRVLWHTGGMTSVIYRDVETGFLIVLLNNVRIPDAFETAHKIHEVLR